MNKKVLKYIWILILFIALHISKIFAQQCYIYEGHRWQTVLVTYHINNYLNTLKKYQKEGAYAELDKMEDKDFNVIMKEAYEAIEIAPTEITKIMLTDMAYNNAQSDFLRILKKRYSRFLYALIRVPIFVKAKIITRREVMKGGFRQINLRLEPEYIIKGKESFLFQSEFEVYYREYEHVSESKDFKIGKSYLFPLWDRGEPDNSDFAIATWVDGRGSRFLIENNLLHDEYTFFDMGTKVRWDVFVKNINETISKIINEKGLDIYKIQFKQERETL